VQITEGQNSELKFTHNTVNSLFTASRSPHTRLILFGQIVIQIQITQNYVIEIKNTFG